MGSLAMHPDPQVDASLDGLRKRVLTTAMTLTAIAAPLVALVIGVRAALEGRPVTPLAIGLYAYPLSFPILRLLARRLPFRVVGAVYLLLMLVMAFAIQVRGGISMASAVIQLLVVVLAALLYGRRGVMLALGADLLCFAAAAALLLGGHAPPIVASMWDPLQPAVWLRAGLILAFFGGAAGIAVVYVVDRLEREAGMLRSALSREQAQHDAVMQAEAERGRAQVALAEAQRVEALGRLASGVAHDFNNILTVVLGACELAQSTRDPEVVQQSLALIRDSSSKAAELTRSLLLVARKDPAQPKALPIDATLRGLAGAIERLLPSDIELETSFDCSDHVLVDPLQLERVVLNLTVNARDAVKAGGRIQLGCASRQLAPGEHGLASGDYVAIFVRDDGVGMDAQTVERIFEPFYTTKPGDRGTGLGMALVQGFAGEAGGAVVVESAPGAGTEVTVLLPRVGAPAAAQRSGAVEELSAAEATPAGTVLVVEDEPAVRSAMVRILRAQGFEVIEAGDGDSALRMVDDARVAIDLLCIDGVIPGAGSAQVIARLRERRPDTPVVVCTGYVDEELLRRGIRAGELSCVRKPFTSGELVGCIRGALAVRAQERPSAAGAS